MSTLIDKLVAQKILWPDGDMPADQIIPAYSQDPDSALQAVLSFTRRGGSIRMLKNGNQVWDVTAWLTPKGRQHTEVGNLALALCRAMLSAVGVSVKSSDTK